MSFDNSVMVLGGGRGQGAWGGFVEHVQGAPGRLPVGRRRDVFDQTRSGRPDESALGKFCTLIAERSHRVTVQDIATLERSGLSADESSRRLSSRRSVRRSGGWMPLSRPSRVADVLLDIVETGHDRPTATFIRLLERITGVALPDVVKVSWYRHRFFGAPFNDRVQAEMRGPSFWSVAERELFAARTSKLNTCPFCVSGHQPVAASYGGSEVAAAVEARNTASIGAEVKAALVFLDKLAVDPDSVGAPDAAAVVNAGVPAGALEEAVRIAVLFHVINRVMNALGSTALPERQQRMGVRLIRLLGYRTPLVVRILSEAR